MKPMNEKHLAILRRHMVEVIAIHFDMASEEIGKARIGARLEQALTEVPRHLFVPAKLASIAYHDTPVPLGFDKTLSQPFIAALMIDLLDIGPGHRVLEVGTGLGYQSAVMAALGAEVWTVEVVEEFTSAAAMRLLALGHVGVSLRIGDGSRGWAEHAPFDRILVTAASREVPKLLLDQLEDGGRMVIPLGGEGDGQKLSLVEKSAGAIIVREVIPVRFTQLETMAC
jgi:protein-L-isoaspartate(D-aspartate) O-methyltransferase